MQDAIRFLDSQAGSSDRQPDWVTQDEATRFLYGSIGAEHNAGIPYWIFYVLPWMFPEKVPGTGGYASLAAPWEEGHESGTRVSGIQRDGLIEYLKTL